MRYEPVEITGGQSCRVLHLFSVSLSLSLSFVIGHFGGDAVRP